MAIEQGDQLLINTTDVSTSSKLWRPIRPLVQMSPYDDQITKLQKKVQPPSKTTNPKPAGTPTNENLGEPYQLLAISATESPSKQQDRTFSQVAVTFLRNSTDPAYDHVNIWLRGYKGNAQRVLQTQGAESPIYFLLETTGETITITGQPVGPDGTAAPIELSRVCTVKLDGVVSAPPAPTISQSLIATPTGYQFTFLQLPPQAADVIDSYKVYRNTVNNSATAQVLKTYKHDQTDANDPIVVQDTTTGGTIYWYWVSAVNTVGLESVLEPAQSSAVYHGARAQSIVSGVVSSLPLLTNGTTLTSAYYAATAMTLPGAFELWCYVTNASDEIIDVLLWASNTSSKPNGYFFRFDNRSGVNAGQIWKVTAGAWSYVGTQIAATNAARLTTGWYKLRGEWAADGVMNVYVDDVWQATYVDTTYTPTGAVYIGAELSATDPRVSNTDGSTGLNNQGSLATITGLGFSYTSTSSSITWSWASGTIYNLDGSVINVSSGTSSAFTGLSASTTYYFGAYYDIATGTIVVVLSDTTSGKAKCSIQQIAQVFNLDGHIPLNIDFTAATTSSGSGGGSSGGGPGSCFSGNTRVRTQRGMTPISEVQPGDFVITAALTWRKVIGTTCKPYAGEFIDMGDGELVTLTHKMFANGEWRNAENCVPGPRVYREIDVWNLHVEAKGLNEHSYTLGNALVAHNVILPT